MSALFSKVARSDMWLFDLYDIKLKIQFSVTLTTFQVLRSHMWLIATGLDGTDYRTFPSMQKFLLGSTAPGFSFAIHLFLFFFYFIHCE